MTFRAASDHSVLMQQPSPRRHSVVQEIRSGFLNLGHPAFIRKAAPEPVHDFVEFCLCSVTDRVIQFFPCVSGAVFHVAGQTDEILRQMEFIHYENQAIDPFHPGFDPSASVCAQVDPFDPIHIVGVANIPVDPVPESIVLPVAVDVCEIPGMFQMVPPALWRIRFDSLMDIDHLADQCVIFPAGRIFLQIPFVF